MRTERAMAKASEHFSEIDFKEKKFISRDKAKGIM